MLTELTVEQVRQQCEMVLFQCNSVEELGHRVQVAESSLKGLELNKIAGFRYDFS